MSSVFVAAPSEMAGAWNAALEFALVHNKRYLYGGEDPVWGLDCSGLVSWALRAIGVAPSIPMGIEGSRKYQRFTAHDLRKNIFSRPSSSTRYGDDKYFATGYGPDPALGDYAPLFYVMISYWGDWASTPEHAYNYGARVCHIAASFGPGLVIESNELVKMPERVVTNITESEGGPSGTAIGWYRGKEPAMDGVHVVDCDTFAARAHTDSRLFYLDWDAVVKAGWTFPFPGMGIQTTKR